MGHGWEDPAGIGLGLRELCNSLLCLPQPKSSHFKSSPGQEAGWHIPELITRGAEITQNL